jgi:hypothetical protein
MGGNAWPFIAIGLFLLIIFGGIYIYIFVDEFKRKKFQVKQAVLEQLRVWQNNMTQQFQIFRQRAQLINREGVIIGNSMITFKSQLDQLKNQLRLNGLITDSITFKLAQGWQNLEANLPAGLERIIFQAPNLVFWFQNPRDRRRNIPVLVNLESGSVMGEINPWPPETRLAAMKTLSQGNLAGLARMIQNSLRR